MYCILFIKARINSQRTSLPVDVSVKQSHDNETNETEAVGRCCPVFESELKQLRGCTDNR